MFLCKEHRRTVKKALEKKNFFPIFYCIKNFKIVKVMKKMIRYFDDVKEKRFYSTKKIYNLL